MRSPYQRPRPRAAINITPYIDILLVLLIIFMVIQPTTQFQLPARAPSKPVKVAGAAVPSSLIVVTIDEQFQLSINTQPVSFPDLGRTLFDILSARADRRIYIKGPPDLPFGDVVRIIDIAKGAGAGDIGLI